MYICDDCHLEVEYGPCLGCQERREEEAMIEAMDDDEYDEMMRKRRSLRITQVGLTNTLLNLTKRVA